MTHTGIPTNRNARFLLAKDIVRKSAIRSDAIKSDARR